MYVELISESLSVYGKAIANVVCFIGENCSVNHRIHNLTNIPLIVCYDHKSSLAVEQWIGCQEGLVDALGCISDLMTQLQRLKNAARGRELTRLDDVLPSKTC